MNNSLRKLRARLIEALERHGVSSEVIEQAEREVASP